MRIVSMRTLQGPNVYLNKPIIIMELDLEELSERETREFPGFNDRLLQLLPGLHDHHCAFGRPGGLIRRLQGGTYFGHVIEHTALELAGLSGQEAHFGKTIDAGAPGVYFLIVEFEAEQAMRYLLTVAVQLAAALLRDEPFDIEPHLTEARRIIARTELGPSTRAIVDAAERRGIPVRRLNQRSLVQLGHGKRRKLVQATLADGTGAIAVDIAGDKQITKSLLEQAWLPVPRGRAVATHDEALEALAELEPPVVVKPLDGHQGKGVSIQLSTPEEVLAAFEIAREFSSHVMIEEYLTGEDYRVLVVGGRMVAAARRVPPYVTGDGLHTVQQLVDRENENPLRGDGHEKPLTCIRIDQIVLAWLARQGVTLASVPGPGQVVTLRQGANLSTGGSAIDVTDELHPSIVRACERAATVIGLDICGLDLVLRDIHLPIEAGGGGIVEANAAPGIRMHLYPTQGTPRPVGDAIVEMLYPAGASGRIPIISVTGTNGKTTTTRLIEFILASTGLAVGMTTTDGIYIAGQEIARGDMTGPRSARTVLADPSVEVAVLETARGGIVRSGLGYDWSDISIITNIQLDHVGQDGIESIDDLVNIKSLVAERVREGGTLILNLDDEQTPRIIALKRVMRPQRRIVYFTLCPDSRANEELLLAGSVVYYPSGGWIVEAAGQAVTEIVEIAAVPLTLDGNASFHVANTMAAVAACRAFGLTPQQIASALPHFRAEWHNPGRSNLYRVGGSYVMVDYGHNPPAFQAICRLGQRVRRQGQRVTGIIAVPGDRADHVVRDAAAVAARGFDRLIIREDRDLRGRKKGEIAQLLSQAVHAVEPDREVSVILDEADALATALRDAREGELIVIFYEEYEVIAGLLERHGAQVLSGVSELAPGWSMEELYCAGLTAHARDR